VIVQTRRGDDLVLGALSHARFEEIVADDVATAQILMLAPYGAAADVSGDGAQEFVAGLSSARVTAQVTPEGFVVRAKDVTTLTRALREAARPTAKVRVAVQ
jgi:hypothetical protein